MPVRANTQLRVEYQTQVQARFDELLLTSGCASVNVFISDRLHLVVSTYHRFVTHLEPVTHSIAAQYLGALQFERHDIDAMLRDVDRRDDGSASPMPPPVVPDVRNNLPSALTKLIGRDQEIAEVMDQIDSNRLVTLVGAGGVGKTQLAIALAHKALPRFHDGVRFVELDGLAKSNLLEGGASRSVDSNSGSSQAVDTKPNPIATEVARVLELKEQQGESITATLANWISDRSMLIVLDNCEHLLDCSVRLVKDLSKSCANLHVLATSLAQLGLFKEYIHRVPSLDYPTSPMAGIDLNSDENTASDLLKYSAVRLFVERAAAQGVPRQADMTQLLVVAEICRELDGIPLAIEMAAARVRSMPIKEICDGLSDRFNLLRGERTSLGRQKTLGALIEWSQELLSESEKALLYRSSVFAGGWNLMAAVSLFSQVGVDPVLDLLTSLVDLSLVKYEERDNRARYRMPETVRMYAAAALVKRGEYEDIRNRHMAYFKKLLEDAEPNLNGPQRGWWLNRLLEDYENLRSALAWCLSTSNPSIGLRLCGALKAVWQTQGLYTEGREWCKRALGNLSDADKSSDRAKVLNVSSYLAWNQGDNAAARLYSEQSLTLSTEIGSRQEEAMALVNISNVDLSQGAYSMARDNIAHALSIFENMNNLWGVALAHNNLGTAADFEGDLASAKSHYERSLQIKRGIGDAIGIGTSLNNLGILLQSEGDYVSARERFEESLSTMRKVHDRRGIARALNNLGTVLQLQGDLVSARSYHKESLDIEKEIGARGGIAESLGNLGALALAEGDYQSARCYFEESLAIQRSIVDKLGTATTLTNLGSVECAVGNFDLARMHLGESLSIKRDIGDKIGIAFTLEAIAGLEYKQNERVRASILWGAAGKLRDEIKSPLPASERAAYDHEVSRTREALGEGTFSAAWAAGHETSLEHAIELALECVEGRKTP